MSSSQNFSDLPQDISLDDVKIFFETSLDLVLLIDREGSIRYLNPAWEKHLGWTRDELLSMNLLELIHPEDRERSMSAFHTVLSGHDVSHFENRYLSKDGSYHTLMWTVPAVQAGARFSYASARDRTERKLTEEKLRDNEERYRIVVENSGQLIYDYNVLTGDIIWAGAMADITGYPPDEFSAMDISKWEEHLHPEDRDSALSLLHDAMVGHCKYQVRYRFRHRDGHYVYIADTGLFLYYNNGQAYRMLGTMSDITPMVTYEQASRESEAQLRASLRDKELLLREIHHRVKNNLQIISSLLSLQALQVDERIREFFQESRDRVRSMALIHEQLYAADDFASVRMAGYMRQLVTNLVRSYGTTAIELSLDIDPDIAIEIDEAIPCGLIVNELVSNALKYAFVNRDSGTVTISFSANERQRKLVVADDGCGLPESVTPSSVRSLGLQLVDTLVQQIGAQMSIDRHNGTVFTIVCPVR